MPFAGPKAARRIIAEVARETGYRVDQLTGPSRLAGVTRARHLAMLRVHDHTILSLQEIGDLFGRRDHSTVIAALRRARERAAA